MIDYKKLGFKSGLEIHQQLDSHKLFCSCPSLLRRDEPDFLVKRRLHAVAGESGEIDVAARHETALKKEFVYQGYRDTTCLVELDEEPPHFLNQEALEIVLHLALHFHMTILSLTQIMRKTVVDGSNTSGFQRTVMIARDGYVETSEGRVGIEALFLEEDSARSVERNEKKVVYRLDRLGVPLVEIATAPDIKNAEHAKETALLIGEILRSCKVKRGIGTIRQDINISLSGTNRVELKGFQDPKIMVQTVENEVLRQKSFLDKKETNPSEVRNVLSDGTSEFLRPMPGSARMYPETDLPLLSVSKSLIEHAKRTLPKLRSELEKEFRKEGLSKEFITLLFKQRKVDLYREAYYHFPKPGVLAPLLLIFPKELAKKKKLEFSLVEDIFKEYLVEVLDLVNAKNIREEDILVVLERLVEGKSLEDAQKIEKVEVGDIEEDIHKIIKEKPGLSSNAYMGLVMKAFKGKVNGKEVMEILKKFMK